MRFLMKPKIQLVGGCATSFVNEVADTQLPDSGNDRSKSAALKSSEAGMLLAGFLATIIKTVGASAGIVRVLSPDGHQFRSIAASGMLAESCNDGSAVDAGCGVCGKAADTQTVETSDAEFCMSRYGAVFFGAACKYVLAVPMVNGDNKSESTGVLTLFFATEQNIGEGTTRTLQSYADLMQIALQSVWQNEDRRQCDLLAERQSIANEIHDSLAQTLYFAKIRASLLLDAMKADNELLAYKCAQDIEEALEGSQKTVRELVTHFRCQMDPRGLKFALQKLVKDFMARTNIAFKYINDIEEMYLPKEHELQVFLIIRESLVNIATHSGATIAGLTVVCTAGKYQFVVEDNGGGVDSSVPHEGHYGLEIMRERALRIGGEFEVESLQGLGTRVQLTFSAPVA